MISSSTETIKPVETWYVVSEPESWGQPPAECYLFVVEGERMYGQLVLGDHVSSRSTLQHDDYWPNSRFQQQIDVSQEEEWAALYAECAEEDRQLAAFGMARYAEMLCEEENCYEAG